MSDTIPTYYSLANVEGNTLTEYHASPIEIEFEDQKTFVALPKHINTIGVSLSGGLDSSLAMYFVLKYISENNLNITVYPCTGVDRRRPTNRFDVEDITQYLKNKFPDVDIRENQWWDNTKEFVEGVYYDKVDKDKKELAKIAIKNNIRLYVNGRTSNPPQSVLDTFNAKWEESRSHGRTEKTLYESIRQPGFWHHRPWENCDKKLIAHLYEQENLWDMFDMTWSCVQYATQTKWFTEPCGECYWCKEKEWAFGKC